MCSLSLSLSLSLSVYVRKRLRDEGKINGVSLSLSLSLWASWIRNHALVFLRSQDLYFHRIADIVSELSFYAFNGWRKNEKEK